MDNGGLHQDLHLPSRTMAVTTHRCLEAKDMVMFSTVRLHTDTSHQAAEAIRCNASETSRASGSDLHCHLVGQLETSTIYRSRLSHHNHERTQAQYSRVPHYPTTYEALCCDWSSACCKSCIPELLMRWRMKPHTNRHRRTSLYTHAMFFA